MNGSGLTVDERNERQISAARGRWGHLSPRPEALALVPYEASRRLRVLPMSLKEDGGLIAATPHPDDMLLADELRALSKTRVELIGTPFPPREFAQEIDRAYRFSDAVARLADPMAGARPEAAASEHDDSSPAAGIVERIIEQAVRERASDIHIEPGETSTRVRFRVDGRLAPALEMPSAAHPSVTARIKILAQMDIAEKRTPQDGHIMREIDGRRIDLRVSTLPGIRGEKTVLRVLDRESALFRLDDLGCMPRAADAIRALLSARRGLILNTGPTGCGKTTTMHAMIAELDLDEFNAVTIEDPVEYRIPQATQVQVNEKSGLTFASILRYVLRQDPDVIFVGEIRDEETASLAIRAAVTGHLVLATLHCGDAYSAPARLADMGVPPYLLAATLRGVISQRLLRRLCPDCRLRDESAAGALRALGLPPSLVAYRAGGCPRCGGRGYRGRAAAFEVMPVSPSLARAVARGASALEIGEIARREGALTLRESAAELVRTGVTGCEEALGCLEA